MRFVAYWLEVRSSNLLLSGLIKKKILASNFRDSHEIRADLINLQQHRRKKAFTRKHFFVVKLNS